MLKTIKKEKPAAKKEAAVKSKKPVAKIVKPKPAVKVKKVAAVKVKKAATIKKKLAIKKEKPAAAKEVVVAAKPAEKMIPEAVVARIIDHHAKPAIPHVHAGPTEVRKPAAEIKSVLKPEMPKQHKPEEKATIAPAPALIVPPVAIPDLRELELELPITVKDLAIRLQEKPSIIIKMLMDSGTMVGINHSLEEPLVAKICERYKCRIKKAPDAEELALGIHQEKDLARDLKPRSPIVTFMGHVDHGKTSLMDAIRKTKIAESEHGGITQHIGAYRVNLAHGEITFLDTPGHEAFTAMRSRGASITDIVVLVVAADDGMMPQTMEAIDHARAAGVPIIVAINKIDKPQANLDRVKKQLSEADLRSEEWGGKTITVGVSAKTGQGIDELLEMLLLEAQMLELKANPGKLARGVVLEAKMARGRGPVATLLVQNGTLHLNSTIVVGNFYGKIRAMADHLGHSVTSAGPSTPIEVLGISDVPDAGEQFFVIEDEKKAKELAAQRLAKDKQQQIKSVKRISLEDLHSEIAAGKIKELKVIVKSDVQGSLEAIKDTLEKLNVSEINLQVIHSGVGNVNSSDVILAVASNALILGFNVTADDRAKEIIEKEGVDFKNYNIIYELGNDIKAAVEGMLEPKIKKVFVGRVEVRKMLKLTKAGLVAGSFVLKGKVTRHSIVSVLRNGLSVFEGKVSTLKRFKDDVKEVAEGFECGITLANFDQLLEGDIIEAYDIEKIARKL